jgi:hypothetical protein
MLYAYFERKEKGRRKDAEEGNEALSFFNSHFIPLFSRPLTKGPKKSRRTKDGIFLLRLCLKDLTLFLSLAVHANSQLYQGQKEMIHIMIMREKNCVRP